MKKKVLILGSEGQVGAHLKDYLNRKSYSVLEFDIAKSKSQDLRAFRNKKLSNLIKKSHFIYFLAHSWAAYLSCTAGLHNWSGEMNWS